MKGKLYGVMFGVAVIAMFSMSVLPTSASAEKTWDKGDKKTKSVNADFDNNGWVGGAYKGWELGYLWDTNGNHGFVIAVAQSIKVSDYYYNGIHYDYPITSRKHTQEEVDNHYGWGTDHEYDTSTSDLSDSDIEYGSGHATASFKGDIYWNHKTRWWFWNDWNHDEQYRYWTFSNTYDIPSGGPQVNSE